jgi:hypothetical protein
MPLIVATQKTETKEIGIRNQPRLGVLEAPSQPKPVGGYVPVMPSYLGGWDQEHFSGQPGQKMFERPQTQQKKARHTGMHLSS